MAVEIVRENTLVMLLGGHTTLIKGKTPSEVRAMLKFEDGLNPLQSNDLPPQDNDPLVDSSAVVALIATNRI
jgi:hypothetical protein